MRILFSLLVVLSYSFVEAAEYPAVQPSKEQVQAALEILKLAHARVEEEGFQYSDYGKKALAATGAITGGSGFMTVALDVLPATFRILPIGQLVERAALGGMVVGIFGSATVVGVTTVVFVIESGTYLVKNAIRPANAAALDAGILKDPRLMQRFLDLPVETQLAVAEPELQARVIALAQKALPR